MTSYKDLAAQMQEATGITTSQPMQHWMADVLHRVARECAERNEPNLAPSPSTPRAASGRRTPRPS